MFKFCENVVLISVMVSAIYSFEMKFIKCNILRYLILVNRGTCTICRDVAQLLVSLVAMSNLIIKLYIMTALFAHLLKRSFLLKLLTKELSTYSA